MLVRGMRMGSVREVKVTFDAAHARFDIPVTISLTLVRSLQANRRMWPPQGP